jgi:hypothetical protein
VYYSDGDSSQWVQTASSLSGGGDIRGRVGSLETRTTNVETLNTTQDGRLTSLEGYAQQSPNYIINGAMDVWQRGASISVTANATYTADRWIVQFNGSGATRTVSQQTFTPGAAPVGGYEGTYFLRFAQSVAGSGASFNSIGQRIEDVRTLAGQTVTVSFWAKAASTITIPNMSLWQNFGTGGSSTVETQFASSLSIGTSWTRYSYTVTLPSISGKTIGTSSYLHLEMYQPVNQTFTLDLWGVQVEKGSIATPFRRNGPSIQAELAACHRYYQFHDYIVGVGDSAGYKFGTNPLGQLLRTTPTVTADTKSGPTLGTTYSTATSQSVLGKGGFYNGAGATAGNFVVFTNVLVNAEL